VFSKKEKYYHSLYEIAAVVNSVDSPDDVLESIVEYVAKAMDAKGCSIMLATPDRKLLLHTAAYGLRDRYIRKGPVSADRSIAEALWGCPVSVVNATEDDRIQYRKQAKEEGISSILSVPVMLKGQVIGVMRVYTAEQRHFVDPDIYFVGAVANLGAIAMENARLYEATRKDYEELRKDVTEWRAALGCEWMNEELVLPERDLSSADNNIEVEEQMIRVIIERHCKPDRCAEMEQLLMELRTKATPFHGYISGETLQSRDDPSFWLVISTWVDIDSWKAWEMSLKRDEAARKIEPLLTTPEKVTIFDFARRGVTMSAHTLDK